MTALPPDFSPEERASRAEQYFLKGYNCCQSVLLAYADVLESSGMTEVLLATIGSGFGGGMARMREVCGSFSAVVMIAGFLSPAVNPSVMQERTANYALVQKLAQDFKELNGGSIVCRELLGISAGKQEKPAPSERTAEYYKKRPCGKIIFNAAFIVGRYMIDNQQI